jgi:hypothetical protein
MPSISMLNQLLRRGSTPMSFESHNPQTRKSARGDSRGAAASALTRALLQNAVQAGATTTAGNGLPSGNPSSGNPLSANLGNLIDLRASLTTRTEDTSLTIRTAEGDTVTLTSHSELQSLKARLTYGPGDSPAVPAAGMNAPAATPVGNEDDAPGVTKAKLREIRLDERVTLSVQGDLSEQELEDIKQLVNKLGSALYELGEHGADHDQDGDEGGQAGSFTRIDTRGMGTLAGFELHVERTVEVTKIHVTRTPPPATTVTPIGTGTVTPGTVPGKGTISTPPIPVSSPVKKPKAGPVAPPVVPQPPVPLWKVDVFSARISTVADMLYQRSADPTHGPHDPDSALPLLASPARMP